LARIKEASRILHFNLTFSITDLPTGQLADTAYKATTDSAASGNKAPNDAFEVALLDTNTYNPLASTINLSNSDSLLNIQANGTLTPLLPGGEFSYKPHPSYVGTDADIIC
jgi:hypothetical protein